MQSVLCILTSSQKEDERSSSLCFIVEHFAFVRISSTYSGFAMLLPPSFSVSSLCANCELVLVLL